MGQLTIKRKKQSGKAFHDMLKVMIDGSQSIEIANGETKTIELPDGKHLVNFSYYFSAESLPMTLSFMANSDMFKIDCKHEEEFELNGAAEYSISISSDLRTFNIQRNKQQVDVKHQSSGLMGMAKKACFSGIFLLLSLAALEIGIFCFEDPFPFLAFFLYSLMLLCIPSVINIYQTVKADEDRRKELDEAFKKYVRYALITLAVLTVIIVLMLVLFFGNHLVVYSIFSFVCVAIAAIVMLATKLKEKSVKLVCLILVGTMLFMAIGLGLSQPGSPYDADSIDGWDPCMTCEGYGKVRNSYGFPMTCPVCDGVGWIED